MSQGSRGFTLVEVLVATLLLGGVALIVRQTLSQMQRAANAIERTTEEHDARVNGTRELRALLDNMIQPNIPSGTDDSLTRKRHNGLIANSSSMEFDTMCRDAYNDLAECKVRIRATTQFSDTQLNLVHSSNRWWLVASIPRSEQIVLAQAVNPIRLLFLATPNDGGAWSESWTPLVHLPSAVGLVIGDDTTLFRVGGGWE